MTTLLDMVHDASAWLAGHALLPTAFTHAFMARALVATVLVGVVFGALSPMVQARRLAFFSAALGQSALVGVAVGLALGEPIDAPWGGLFGVTIMAALWLVYARRHVALPPDTLIGVFLALALAAGVTAMVAVTRQFNVHQVEGVLFGSPLAVTEGDLGLLLVVGAVVIVVVAVTTRPLLLDALDPGLAAATGQRAVLAEYVFVGVLACAVVVAIRVVGALLVEALVVVPAAAARLVAPSWRAMTVASVGLSITAGVGGLVVSSASPVPTGAAVVLLLGAAFIVAALLGGRRS